MGILEQYCGQGLGNLSITARIKRQREVRCTGELKSP